MFWRIFICPEINGDYADPTAGHGIFYRGNRFIKSQAAVYGFCLGQGWIKGVGAGAGKSGLAFNYVIRTNDAQVELYIDQGETEANKTTFDQLFASKEQV